MSNPKHLGNHNESNAHMNGTHTITSSSPSSLPTSASSTLITSDGYPHSHIHHSIDASTFTIGRFPATSTSLSSPLATPTSANNSSEPPPNIMGAQYEKPGSAGIVIAGVTGTLGILCTVLTVIHCLQLRARKHQAKRIIDYDSEFNFSDRSSDNESNMMFLTFTTRSQSTLSFQNQSKSTQSIKSKIHPTLEKCQTSDILKPYNKSNDDDDLVEKVEGYEESEQSIFNVDNVDLKVPSKL
ncbi:hypothetical protein DFH28DRAFT_956137 [Melampsora americana]|nr:hypothetical protein DFH28DRAFT_956137 [Melampsora americana]